MRFPIPKLFDFMKHTFATLAPDSSQHEFTGWNGKSEATRANIIGELMDCK